MKTFLTKTKLKQVLEYYKAVCTFPYTTQHPIIQESVLTRTVFVHLLHHFAMKDPNFQKHEKAVHSLYEHVFHVDKSIIQTLSKKTTKQLLESIRQLRYTFKKYSLRFYTYKFVFLVNYLILRYGAIQKDDSHLVELIQKGHFHIHPKDMGTILDFSNVIKLGDLTQAEEILKKKKYRSLQFFYDAFKQVHVQQNQENKNLLIVGTMSAGKSTYLNCMVGNDVFPSRNEPCTAKLFTYTHRPGIDYLFLEQNKKFYSSVGVKVLN